MGGDAAGSVCVGRFADSSVPARVHCDQPCLRSRSFIRGGGRVPSMGRSVEGGREALGAWRAGARERATVATAVRFTVAELGAAAPGRSVEVRVPPFAAVQIIAGTSHRRGTPPAVIEMDANTWLQVATGALAWADAVASGRVLASGERADLQAFVPLRTVMDSF